MAEEEEEERQEAPRSQPPFKCALHAGDVLAGRFQIRSRMGMGGFASLFLGEDLVTGHEVAIKAQVEREGLNHNALRLEGEVLAKIQGRFAPRLLAYSAGGELLPSTLAAGSGSGSGSGKGEAGSEKRAGSPFRRKAPPSIVMELLRGEDMSELRHRQASAPRVHPRVAVHLGQEMVRLLRRLHGLGFVHRDIKPNNFMRKARGDRAFQVIDFGVSKNLRSSSGEIKPERQSAEFRGTTMYAPVRSHLQRDISFRDDLQSVAFVFLDLLLGRLPWFEPARAKDKARVLQMKQELVTDPRAVLEDHPVMAALPNKEQIIASLTALLGHLESLGFQDEPDYEKCLALLEAMVMSGEEDLESLPPGAFDWEGDKAAAAAAVAEGEGSQPQPPGGAPAAAAAAAPASGYQRAKQEEAGMDAGMRNLLLSKQVLALCTGREDGDITGAKTPRGRERNSVGFYTASSGGGGGGGKGAEVVEAAASLTELELARMWARVGKRLVEDDGRPLDPQQRLEQLGRCMALARRHGTFFLVDGLTEEEWGELQLEAVHKVERAYSRAKKKRQRR